MQHLYEEVLLPVTNYIFSEEAQMQAIPGDIFYVSGPRNVAGECYHQAGSNVTSVILPFTSLFDVTCGC